MSQAGCPSLEQLSAYRRGTTPPDDRERLAGHITACNQCQTMLKELADGAAASKNSTSKSGSSAEKTHVGFRTPAAGGDTIKQTPSSSISQRDLGDGRIAAVFQGQRGAVQLTLQGPQDSDEIGRMANYRVKRLLGSGGMGMVFLAEDEVLRRPVALKVIQPGLQDQSEGWQRLLREARSMAAIKHEHLVTVYQAGRVEDQFYLAMELLEGESLEERIGRMPLLEVPELLRMSREIASGLAAIHQHGLIHRDIKPSNIWLEGPKAHAKILDFGLARSTDNSQTTNLTEAGTVVGTPAFMSPEHARGEELDARSDLFSYGCVLYCMCTGTKPFRGGSLVAQLTALAVDTPAPVHEADPRLPLALSYLVARLLDKNPAARPQTADAVVEEIKQIEAGTAVAGPMPTMRLAQSGPVPAASGSQKNEKRRSPLVPLLAGVALAMLAWALWPPPPKPRDQVHEGPPPKTHKGPEPEPPPPVQPVKENRPPQEQPPPDDPRPVGDKRPPHKPEPAAAADIATLIKEHLAAVPENERAYALDVPILDMEVVYFPKASGRKGKPMRREPPNFFNFFKVQDEESPHGIGMHPQPEGSAHVRFKLDKQYDTFYAVVSQNDGLPAIGSAVTFTVSSGGKTLWESKGVTSQDDTQRCVVSVKGCDDVELEVTSAGDPRAGHCIWFEPYFKK